VGGSERACGPYQRDYVGDGMSDLHKAAQALVDRWDTPLWKDAPHTGQYIDALRAALAQPEPYPLPDSLYPDSKDWIASDYAGRVEWLHFMYKSKKREVEHLETAQPERKPLTEDEIELAYREIWRDLSDGFSHTSAEWIEAGIRYAEKAHGIGD